MRNFWLQIKTFFQNLWVGLKNLKTFRRHQLPQILETFSKKEINTVLIALLIFILAGGFLVVNALSSKGPGPRYGGDLKEGVIGQPQFINPLLASNSTVDSDLSRIIYAQILKYDQSENLTPDLASSLPQISSDQKTYTIKLRPDLKWSDGQPLNADDVVFTIQTIQNSAFGSPLRPNWARVKVTKLDDLTISFTLREISASFINNFALGILPKHIWQGINASSFRLTDNNLKPIGSGPFVLKQIKKSSAGTIKSITLIPNDQYYQGRPYLNTVTFNFYDGYDSLISAYQGREIQSLGFVPFDRNNFLAGSNKTNQDRVNLPQYQAAFFNLAKNPILADKAVRQALSLATNRDTIINDAYLGNAAAAFSPILEGSLGYDPTVAESVHFDLNQAASILNTDGWVLDTATNLRMKNKKPLEFNLVTNGDDVINPKIAQILQGQWQQIGAKVDLVIVGSDELELQYIRPRNFDALLFSENIGADPDPFAFWSSSQSHDPGLNLSGFNNTTADKLLTQARQTSDTSVRANDYVQFQQIINDQLPAIFLVRSLYIYSTPKNLQGINLKNVISASERFTDINHWYFGS
jgi:peptide/nickel transport system substrate-binding protein